MQETSSREDEKQWKIANLNWHPRKNNYQMSELEATLEITHIHPLNNPLFDVIKKGKAW